MKKSIAILVLFLLVVVGVFAQSQPRRGVYTNSAGLEMGISPLPGRIGVYHISMIYGRVGDWSSVEVYNMEGRIVGNRLEVVMTWVNQKALADLGVYNIHTGDTGTMTIVSNTQIRGADGNLWVWNRDV